MNAVLTAIDAEIAAHARAIEKLDQARDLLTDETVAPAPEPVAEPTLPPEPKRALVSPVKATRKGAGRPVSEKTKNAESAVLATLVTGDRTITQMLGVLKDNGIDLQYGTLDNMLRRLHTRGMVEPAGKLKNACLWRKVRSESLARSSIKQTTANGSQEPKLEGRVFGLICHRPLTVRELATELDADVDGVQIVLKKLIADGDADIVDGNRVMGRP
jgi:predicted transcriptional regulator